MERRIARLRATQVTSKTVQYKITLATVTSYQSGIVICSQLLPEKPPILRGRKSVPQSRPDADTRAEQSRAKEHEENQTMNDEERVLDSKTEV